MSQTDYTPDPGYEVVEEHVPSRIETYHEMMSALRNAVYYGIPKMTAEEAVETHRMMGQMTREVTRLLSTKRKMGQAVQAYRYLLRLVGQLSEHAPGACDNIWRHLDAVGGDIESLNGGPVYLQK